MFTSHRFSYLALRLGLAAVFLWFGIDKMFHAEYWLNAWITPTMRSMIDQVGFSGTQFVYLSGVFEILIGVSLVTNVMQKLFSLLAIIFLAGVFVFVGFNEVTARDIGLLGGLVSVLLWPEGRGRL
ncbi:MAG: DoxX family protein [Candidatus Yanofskybacteria bacterium]|nr:DoxX family protein [Candidatus Yanofskybacteria bacterium]